MNNSKCVLLWSQSQNCFHIESQEDMLEANAAAFGQNRRMDYVPLWIGTEVDCDLMADSLRQKLVERQQWQRHQDA